MNPALKNILGLLIGAISAVLINGGIIAIGPMLIPLPPGAIVPPPDANMTEAIEIMKKNEPLLGFRDYIIPFLAHALGSLLGAIVAVIISSTHKLTWGLLVSALHLVGGITMAYLLEFPMPFSAIDLIGAYLPMGYLGWLLGKKKMQESTIPDDSSFV